MRHAILLALILASGTVLGQTAGHHSINLLTEKSNLDQTVVLSSPVVSCNDFPVVYSSNYILGGNMVVQLTTVPNSELPELFVDVTQLQLATAPPVGNPSFYPSPADPCAGNFPLPAPMLWAGFSSKHTVDLPAALTVPLTFPLPGVFSLGQPDRVITMPGGASVNEWDVYIAPGTPAGTQSYFQALIPNAFADGDPNPLLSNMMPIYLL